jgi:hypothetical protein
LGNKSRLWYACPPLLICFSGLISLQSRSFTQRLADKLMDEIVKKSRKVAWSIVLMAIVLATIMSVLIIAIF